MTSAASVARVASAADADLPSGARGERVAATHQMFGTREFG
jgi:hypothetical protein